MADTDNLKNTQQTGFTAQDSANLAGVDQNNTGNGAKVQQATVRQNGLEATTTFVTDGDGDVVFNGPSPGKLASDLSRLDYKAQQNSLGDLNRNLATQVNNEAQVKQQKETLMDQVTVQTLQSLANGGGNQIASETKEPGSPNGEGSTGAGVGESTASSTVQGSDGSNGGVKPMSYTLASGQTKPVDEMSRSELDEAAKALNVEGYEFVKNKTEAADKVKAALAARPVA